MKEESFSTMISAAISTMPWWEREKLLTETDKIAIDRARRSSWEDISEDWAETEAGQYEVHCIMTRKYHRDEFSAGMD